MRTPVGEPAAPADDGGLGAAVSRVSGHAKALIGLELELATVELKRKITALVVGIALAVAGAVVALYGVGFLFATIAAVLATFLPTWLALLIVTLFLLIVAAVLVLLGLRRIKRGTPPVPEQAIREAKLTTGALKSDASV